MTRKVLTSADAHSLLLDQTPIGFDVANAQGEPIVYISSDPRFGQLTLTLQNNTSSGITLDADTILKFYLAPLLTNEEVGHVELASSGWTMRLLSDNASVPYLELKFAAPKPAVIGAGQVISIQFEKVLASGVTTSGRFLVEFSGLKPFKDGSQRIPVMRQLPPTQAQDWPLTPGFGTRPEYGDTEDQGNAIYVTPWQVQPGTDAIKNYFRLAIMTSETIAFPGETPSFIISFFSGSGDAALCSDADIGVVIADVDQPSGGAWTVTKDGTAELPLFVVTPAKQTTSFDVGNPIVIKFSNLASTLPPEKSSVVYIQATGLKRYNDGFFVRNIDKVPPVPYVRSFDAYVGDQKVQPGATVGYGNITLKWDVFAAQSCLIEELAHAGKPTDSVSAPAHQTTTSYHLQPLVGTQGFDNRDVSVGVGPPQVAPLNANPNAVAPGGAANLSWTCSNGAYVQLKRGDGTVLVDNGPLVGAYGVNPQSDTSYTVTCFGAVQEASNATVSVPPVAVSISSSDGVIWFTRPAPPNPFDPNPFGPTLGASHEDVHPDAVNAAAVDGVVTNWAVTVSWSTYCANSCRVFRTETNETISTALQGSLTFQGTGTGLWGGAPRQYQIYATGRGSAQATTNTSYQTQFGPGPSIGT